MEKLSNPVYFSPSDLFFDSSYLRGFDGKGTKTSRRDGVHSKAVADIVEVSDLLEVRDQAKPAKGLDGFIFRSFDL